FPSKPSTARYRSRPCCRRNRRRVGAPCRANICSVPGRLAFAGTFHLNGGVPAADDVTSLSATASVPVGAGVFTTTHWSVVLEAQGESPAAQEALENLCRTYWRP